MTSPCSRSGSEGAATVDRGAPPSNPPAANRPREANKLAEQELAAACGEKRFLCGCSARGCVERIPLTEREYEHVGADCDQLVVVPGHESQEVEVVVERFPGYLIVAKFGAAGE